MITNADIIKLKAVFATKEDLIVIKKGIVNIQKILNTAIKLSENQLKYHHIRLTNIEEKIEIKKPDYFLISP